MPYTDVLSVPTIIAIPAVIHAPVLNHKPFNLTEVKQYSTGFLFDYDKEYVMLIKKTKPDWQKGKLNGVGGKIEINETPMNAMIREFKEETDILFTGWKQFCKLCTPRSQVYFYFGYTDKYHMSMYKNLTEETVQMWSLKLLNECNPPRIPNLNWLIPMALTIGTEETSSNFVINQDCHV